MKIQKILKFVSRESFLYPIFLLQLTFWRLPNFYLLPSFPNAFLTTQSIARVALLLLFTVFFVVIKQKKTPRDHQIIFMFIILFFICQSASVIATINTSSFIRRYKDIIIGILAFFVFYQYREKLKPISILFIVTSAIALLYQYVLFFSQGTSLQNMLGYFIYSEHWNIVLAKLADGKIYSDTYEETTIPFSLLNAAATPWGFLNIFLTILTVLMSFLSNIRSKIVMAIVSIGGYILTIQKARIKFIVLSFFVLILLTSAADALTYHFVSYSFLDRITLQDDLEDVRTITDRFGQLENSLDIAGSSLFGAGLGNYFDQLPEQTKNNILTGNWQKPTTQGGIEYVHNYFGTIIAETGFVSFGIFISILILCIKNDIAVFKNGTNLHKAFVISFWSLFSFGLLNPPVPGAYQVLFWGLRALTLI